MGGGGGSSGPTVQQQQLETEQALTSANLNLQENAERKSILNSMMGTRVFRGSALSRAMRGNTPGTGGEQAAPPASASQLNNNESGAVVSSPTFTSLLDPTTNPSLSPSGATPAGGTGGSATGSGVRAGPGGGARVGGNR